MAMTGVDARRFLFNKRLTGWVNIKLRRHFVHQRWLVEAMMDDIRHQRIDHVVITGDITNLSLDCEFELAREIFARMGFHPEQVSVVPGNHDVYTRGAERSQRFARFFAAQITSDVRVASDGDHPSGPFPFVRLRGEAALIGLSTAVARPPLIASGRAGERQLRALAAAMDHPEVKRRTPVVLLHHPLINPPGRLSLLFRGLLDAPAIREILSGRREALVLHGHLHERVHREMSLRGGARVHHIGATSASLLHRLADRMSGYNVYDVGREGLEAVTARIWDERSRRFVNGLVRREP